MLWLGISLFSANLSFHIHSSLLASFLFTCVLFHYCFSLTQVLLATLVGNTRVVGNTRANESLICYSYNEWNMCFSRNRHCSAGILAYQLLLKKGKVVYAQESPSGESTTTECGFNYQLLAVITEVAQWGAPSCIQPQSATDNGVRDGRSN